jgi:hypothetical protein
VSCNEFQCDWIDKKTIWETADDVRAQYWPEGTIPVDAERIVEFKLKLDIVPVKGLLPDIDVDAYIKMDMTGIVVDEDRYMKEKFRNRLRFSLAHELGHFFMHKEFYSKFEVASPEEWKDFILNAPQEAYGRCEWQANEFAGRLLVPRPELKEAVEEVTKIIKSSASVVTYLRKDPDAVLSSVSPQLSKRFGVSEEVISKRVIREGLWPPKIKHLRSHA